jgi:excisionase family DNA binding protein
MQDVMNIKQVAQYLQFAPTTIYRLIEAKQIPATKIGKQYRFSKYEILGWLSANSICKRKYAHTFLMHLFEKSWEHAKLLGIDDYTDDDIDKIVQSVREE